MTHTSPSCPHYFAVMAAYVELRLANLAGSPAAAMAAAMTDIERGGVINVDGVPAPEPLARVTPPLPAPVIDPNAFVKALGEALPIVMRRGR